MKVRYHRANIGGRKHSSSEDVIFFVFQVTFQNHVIKALNDFISKNHSRYVTILPSLMVASTVRVHI